MENDRNKFFGIDNYGNTCFINSALQMLMSNDNLWESCVSKYDFLNKLEDKEKRTIGKLLKVLSDKDEDFSIGEQYDAHEFILKLFDLEESVYKEDIYNLLTDKTTTRVDQKESYINLDIEDDIHTALSKNSLYIVDEESKFIIDKTYTNLTDTIMLTIKRINVSFEKGKMKERKDDSDMHMDEKIYMLENNNQIAYKLRSIIIHKGKNRNSGHYISQRRIKGKWYTFDDETVYKSKPELNKGYIYLYEREYKNIIVEHKYEKNIVRNLSDVSFDETTLIKVGKYLNVKTDINNLVNLIVETLIQSKRKDIIFVLKLIASVQNTYYDTIFSYIVKNLTTETLLKLKINYETDIVKDLHKNINNL